MLLEQTPFLVRNLLEQVRCFCKPPPKGFEKYFEEGKKTKSSLGSGDEVPLKKEAHKPTGSDASDNQRQQAQQRTDWKSFGMFTQSRQQGSGDRQGGNQGRPVGDGNNEDRDRWMLLGAIGAAVLIGSFTFFEVGYKEISWKEFVIK